ncbi:hypothetical protein HOLleu_43666 [Holothuria leucospilota]|uniref:Uncharacterized protein n=1 Tax=Holothuria leucospilota TaxID=206669 RepID=A0A9Q0Y9E9_HOLLE|nr:hypothetical protein HOLleu_43666 [Holothuria leucospilota]
MAHMGTKFFFGQPKQAYKLSDGQPHNCLKSRPYHMVGYCFTFKDVPTTVEDPTTIFGPSPHVMTTTFGPSPHVVTTTSQTTTLPGVTTTLPGVSTHPSGNASRCDLTEFNCGDICIKNELVCDGMFDCPEFGDEMICDRGKDNIFLWQLEKQGII